MRVTNPASNPELLDALAKHFVESKYDLKELIRTICTSTVYRLSRRAQRAQRRRPAELLALPAQAAERRGAARRHRRGDRARRRRSRACRRGRGRCSSPDTAAKKSSGSPARSRNLFPPPPDRGLHVARESILQQILTSPVEPLPFAVRVPATKASQASRCTSEDSVPRRWVISIAISSPRASGFDRPICVFGNVRARCRRHVRGADVTLSNRCLP